MMGSKVLILQAKTVEECSVWLDHLERGIMSYCKKGVRKTVPLLLNS